MMMGPDREEGKGKWIRQCEKAEKLKQLSLVATFCTGCLHDKGEKSIAHKHGHVLDLPQPREKDNVG